MINKNKIKEFLKLKFNKYNIKEMRIIFLLFFAIIITLTYAYVKIPNDLKIIQTMSVPVSNKNFRRKNKFRNCSKITEYFRE